MSRKKVVLFGGGLSALVAGIHLLREGGADQFDVTLLTMEHRLGGKAASWRLPDGRYMEVGFHAIFGYYHEIQSMLARAGHPVTDPRYFTSNHGRHIMYEAEARFANHLDVPQSATDFGAFLHSGILNYKGMSALEKVEAGTWMAKIGAELALFEVSPEIDEHTFTSYCVSKGLPIELTRKTWFRYVLDLAFNYPNTGSAYVGMYGFQRLMGPVNSTVHYFNGPMSEVMVEPITKLFVDLGGKIRFCEKVNRVQLDPNTGQLEGFGTMPMAHTTPVPGVVSHVDWTPMGGSYSLAEAPYPGPGDPATPTGATETWFSRGSDFDEVIWTLPIDSTRTLLRTSPDFKRAVMDKDQLRRIWSLRTVASISLRAWTPEKVMPSSYDTVVMGTPQPVATTIDYTNRVEELRQQSRWGSVVEMEGQEGLLEDFTDEELIKECLENFEDLPFVDSAHVDVEAIMNQQGDHRIDFRRNTADHMRYLLMEWGHWKYRPEQEKSPYENLTFAGDWMNSTQPTSSMEAATRTGRVAANLLRRRYGLEEVGE